MAVDERARHELYATLEEKIGRKDADTMMAYLPPTTFAEVATKSDLESLKAATRADIEGLRADIEGLKAATKADIANLRETTKSDLEVHRAATEAQFDAFESRFDAKLHAALSQMTWRMIVTMMTLVVAVLGVGQVS